MRYRRQFLLLSMVFALCCFAGAAIAEEGKPVAVIEAGTHDFGDAWEGSDVIHDFKIKNTGDADLEIKSVKAG